MVLTQKGRWALLLTAFFVFPAWTQERLQLCAACHGADGNSPDPRLPSIAAQPKVFLENQLILFREGVRRSDAMAPAVKSLQDAEIARLAEHFSKLPARSMETGKADPVLVKRGSLRANELRCGICHLPDYSGQAQIPRLAGQRESYLEAEMRAYRDGKRTGRDTIMAAALHGVSDADIRALAHFLSRSESRR